MIDAPVHPTVATARSTMFWQVRSVSDPLFGRLMSDQLSTIDFAPTDDLLPYLFGFDIGGRIEELILARVVPRQTCGVA
nr:MULTISPECIES: hypothetical protein [unclassified Rhodococcus (in: high G+C Gram-positive bacteria)]